ncbi:type I polyketide synthase [Saccharothrix deserti]|uniref:type I polyketide synthase n=1 Tax=Saccharothrix deserti TaxID=2593674 RepID=UPI00131D7760|nr:type I polyketide synthase [Saccharothrix deserti]
MSGHTPSTEAGLRDWLAANIAETVGLPPEDLDVDRPLVELGLSSRDAVVLAGALGEVTGLDLPVSALWQHPTVAQLARHLSDRTEGGARGEPEPGRTATDEAIAVIGLGCRLPGGVHGPDEFWSLLRDGRDAVRAAPLERWDAMPDGAPRWGGFLDDITGFDAEFFGIAPHEAASMDPQQRLVLEVVQESLQHAAVPADSLRGTATGVFVGISAGEYGAASAVDPARMSPWTATGGALSIAANRVSYLLDLRGPSMAVDTACSSSLVAVHQACQSLRSGESDTALVAGVNLLLTPALTVGFHRAGLLSADGRCKPFDASADGIARAEGCAAVVLKRLSDARRDGDRVLAVIRGSAVNSDGRSNGLMAPNPRAQAELVRRAYRDAGVDPAQVDYVEAHGTGTLLGDPIEAGALGEVLGRDRDPDRPLLIGSVKSNIGHTESAAGLVGLVKTVLAIRHGEIPPSLHFTEPNPHIDFTGLRVVTEPVDWPRYAGRVTAGVSSFGFGGTNAHVVLEEAAALEGATPDDDAVHAVVLSGMSDDRVRRHAEVVADWLRDNDTPLGAVAATLARRRGADRVRAAVVGRDRAEVTDRLRAMAMGQRTPGVVPPQPVRRATDRKLVWVFSGFGSGRPGMARGLLADEPAFAAAVDEVDDLLREHTDVSLRGLLVDPPDAMDFEQGQIALFGVQVGLAALWRSYGVRPAAVIGQSSGEVAAVVVGGALSLTDGVRVAATRARLMGRIDAADSGAMAAVELTTNEIDAFTHDLPDLAIAVHAAPRRNTVAGPRPQIETLIRRAESQGRLATVLPLRTSAHTAAVDQVLAELRAELRSVRRQDGGVPCYSTVTEEPPSFDAEYWAHHMRRPVRFTQAVAAAVGDGHDGFLEVSPHPIALASVEETARDAGLADLLLCGSLRRDQDDTTTFHANRALLAVDGSAPLPDAAVTDVPVVPWQHVRHWLAPTPTAVGTTGHPLLGAHAEVPGGLTHVWHADVGLKALPWLSDHCVHDVPVLPGAAYTEIALAAAVEVLAVPARDLAVSDVVFEGLLALDDQVALSTVAEDDRRGGVRVEIHSKSAGGRWARHATATVVPASPGAVRAPVVCDGLAELALYDRVAESGLHYGPAFRGVRSVVAGDGLAVGAIAVTEEERSAHLPVTLFDSCLQVLAAAAFEPLGVRAGRTYLPVGIGSVRVHGDPRQGVRCEAAVVVVDDRDDELVGSVWLYDDADVLLVEATDVRVRVVDGAAVPVPLSGLAFEMQWERLALPPSSSGSHDWLLLTDQPDDPFVARFAALADAAGDRVRVAGSLRGVDQPVQGVVLMPGAIGGPGMVEAAEREVVVAARVAAELAARQDPPRLWIATREASAVGSGEPGSPGQAALRALVRVLAFEHPRLRASLVDLPRTGDAEALLAELRADQADDEVGWRGRDRHVARLRPTAISAPVTGAVVLPGSYLITGGLGGLGLVVAQWLAGLGATRVVLNGRRGATADSAAELAKIQATGTEVVVVTGDIAEPGVAERVVAAAVAGERRLRGVVHAAGALVDVPVERVDADSVRAAFAPKARGAWRLHEATDGLDLDWWVNFSSAAAMLGSPGQTPYAAANAWLDAFTAWRRSQGLVATTIDFGAWGQVGLARDSDNPLLRPISPAEGIQALEAILLADRPDTGVIRMDRQAAVDLFPELGRRPFFSAVLATPSTVDDEWPGPDALRDVPDAAVLVRRRLRTVVGRVMGYADDQLSTTVALADLGLDSLMAMRARNAVEHDLGVQLPMPLLLRGATLDDVARHVTTELGVVDDVASPGPVETGFVAPRDPTERWLAGLWAEVLGRSRIDVTEDFFAVGGDAERAEVLLAAIRRRLGADAPTGRLMAVPTVEGMADELRSAFEGVDGPVRVLRWSGGRPPLHLFHPAGGPTSVYQPLVELLGDDQPCYGYERLDDVADLTAKAARYVELIREIQPTGPYRLGGWSFGGCLAHEIACQLHAAGERVDVVVMIDSVRPLPSPDVPPTEVLRHRFGRYVEHIQRTHGVTVQLPWEELAGLDDHGQIDAVIAAVAEAGVRMSAGALHHQRTSYLDARTAERFQPKHFPGSVVFYRATVRETLTTVLDPRYLRTLDDDDLGWSDTVDRLDIVPVPGDHLSMIDPPNVEVLAAHLNALLADTPVPRPGEAQ